MSGALAPDLFELMYERSLLYEKCGRYDPWVDLRRRTGVEVTWHTGDVGKWKQPRGVTNFPDLRVTLYLGLNSLQLRSTLAHELVHLDRGPLSEAEVRDDPRAEAREEARVDLLACQRLIDPVVFDALMARCDGRPTPYQVFAALQVDHCHFRKYRGWRARVKRATAVKRWEEARELPAWPAPWIELTRDVYPLAAAFAGAQQA